MLIVSGVVGTCCGEVQHGMLQLVQILRCRMCLSEAGGKAEPQGEHQAEEFFHARIVATGKRANSEGAFWRYSTALRMAQFPASLSQYGPTAMDGQRRHNGGDGKVRPRATGTEHPERRSHHGQIA
jgi:hypothetical protein